jgi:RND family efflux transporter MFP subunit
MKFHPLVVSVVSVACLCGAAPTPPTVSRRAATTPAAAALFPAEGLIGVVYPLHALDLHIEVAGRVDTIAVELGQRVARGDVLVRLDDRSLRNDLAAAQAEEAVAEADLRVATLDRDAAEQRQERREKSHDAWSQEDLDEFRSQMESSRAKAARAEASLKRQQALVANLVDRLSKARVIAPFAGTVTRRYVEPGLLLAPGDPVVRVISDRDLRVRFGAPEALASTLKPGVVLEARFPLVGGRTDLTLLRITPEIDPATGLATAEGTLRLRESLEGRILAGMNVRIFAASSAVGP